MPPTGPPYAQGEHRQSIYHVTQGQAVPGTREKTKEIRVPQEWPEKAVLRKCDVNQTLRLPWGRCKGPVAAQSFAGLKNIKRLEQSGLVSKTTKEEAGRAVKISTLESCWSATTGLVFRRIPLPPGRGGEGGGGGSWGAASRQRQQ